MPAWSLSFDVAFDVDPGDEPAGGDWTDLSTRLRSQEPITVSSGAGRLADAAEGSVTLLLDNYDRLIDPTNPTAVLNLVPMRHARLRATIGATTYPLARGFVDAWPPSWSSFDSFVRVRLVDGFAWLALQDADIDLPAQMTHERITALLDLAGWPAGLRDIGTGVVPLEAFEQASANILRSVQDVAAAEDGDLFVAPDGKITFRSRHDRFNATSQLTLGDGGVAFSASTPVWDTYRLTNIARTELEDGTTYEVIDAVSVDDYGKRVTPIRDLALRKTEAEAIAQWEVERFKVPHLWVDALSVEDAETGALEDVLPLVIGDLVTINHDAPAGGDVNVDLCVEKITHTISAVEWIWTADLSPHFGDGPWFTWDDAPLGWDLDAKWAP